MSKKQKEEHILICPHCEEPVLIEKINCGIFRHAILKRTGKQVPPHLNEKKCEELIRNELIYGCCKPFQIIKTNGNALKIQVCDYI
jgi:hypothetical protein